MYHKITDNSKCQSIMMVPFAYCVGPGIWISLVGLLANIPQMSFDLTVVVVVLVRVFLFFFDFLQRLLAIVPRTRKSQ